MKKILALMLALIMTLSVIPFAAAADAVADHEHYDNNKNDVCDAPGCTEPVHSNHYDNNGNGVCDHPGCTAAVEADKEPEVEAHKHTDANGNGVCDFPGCTEKMPTGEPIGPGLDDDDDDYNGFEHDHTFYGTWKHNSTYHWRECWCGYVKPGSKTKHSFNSRGECRSCGYEKNNYWWDDDDYYYSGDYRVYLTETGRGDTELSTRYADSRDTVYIYTDPDSGYKVRDVEVTTRNGRDVSVTKRSNYVYYFRMPSSDVYVEVSYTGSSRYDKDYIEYSQYFGDSYNDVSSNDWYYSAVNYVTDREIMAGYSYSKFAPNDNMTRAMLAEALYAISNANATGSEKFSDVDRYDDFYEAVVWCSSKGIIEGWNGKFVPNGDITREDLAVMLYRYANYKRYNTKASEDLDQFSDAEKVSSYAEDALEWAVAEGIINGMGNGTLAPQGTTTRAQAAAMIMRFCKSVK